MNLINELLRSTKGTNVTGDPPPPGWWQASDGNWYAPELHPGVQAPQPAPQQVATLTTTGQPPSPRARWFLPSVILLVLVSVFWFGEAVWVASKGGFVQAYFPVFMGLLFAVAAFINYRTYLTRVAPFNRRQSSGTGDPALGLPTLPSFGTYQPGGAPVSSGNRWMDWARYSFRLRILGIAVFGGMILLYDVGGHILNAESGKPTMVTASTAGDIPAQSNLLATAAYLRGEYSANHATFTGVTPMTLEAQPSSHLVWSTGPASGYGDVYSSLSAAGAVATLAMWGSNGTCWFARIDMQLDGGGQPNGTTFLGQAHSECYAASPPVLGWAAAFPPPG